MSSYEGYIVIAGGGLAAVRTAQALRDMGEPGRIWILSEESCPPYDRPPLSKRFLQKKTDEVQIQLLTQQDLKSLAIEVRLSQRVVGIGRDAQRIELEDGRAIGYETLVVATGARPVRLAQFERFTNVHVLRSVEDARRLRDVLRPGVRLGIIGGGFIGLEIAAVATQLGCKVTIVEAASTPLAAILGEKLGEWIRGWHERQGVVFHCGASLHGVGGDHRATALELAGGEMLEIDEVIVGVGQQPNVEWLLESGLEVNHGLVCDAYGRTEDARVFGVGDVVCTKLGDEYRRTRQWTAVTEQARRAAAAIRGIPADEPFVDDFYFWSDQYGSRLQFAGRMPPNPELRWVKGGACEERFVVLCCADSEVRAVLGLGSPREFLTHSAAIRRQQAIDTVPASP